MSVQDQIDRITDEVTEQTNLLGQIVTALEGKAAGGSGGSGGESGNTDDLFTKFIEGNLIDLDSNASLVIDHRFFADTILETVNLPQADAIGSYAFANCERLKTVNIPNVMYINNQAFEGCTELYMTDCTRPQAILENSFGNTNLQALIIRSTVNVPIVGQYAFENTPISSGDGYIYVPRIMVDEYIVTEGWSDYADQIRALEDYTVDGTINGELDVEFNDVDNGIPVICIIDIETGEYDELGWTLTMGSDIDISWSDWIDSDYNDGSWQLDDNGYVILSNMFYATSRDVDTGDIVLATGDDPVVGEGLDSVYVIPIDSASDLM